MRRLLPRPEYLLMGVGLVLVALFAAASLHRAVMSRASLRAFDRAQAVVAASEGGVDTAPAPTPGQVDFSLWSPKRVEAYRASLAVQLGAPLAVLEIPRLGLVVPVLEGTDELVLNRGVGHIEGTARPGSQGNVCIAGHRDGFFRVLKDIAVGDRLELKTLDGAGSFQVEAITIVSPEQVSVLAPTARPTLTLVTCFPFYFVGNAPQRYIVRAAPVNEAR
jgi:sortase A